MVSESTGEVYISCVSAIPSNVSSYNIQPSSSFWSEAITALPLTCDSHAIYQDVRPQPSSLHMRLHPISSISMVPRVPTHRKDVWNKHDRDVWISNLIAKRVLTSIRQSDPRKCGKCRNTPMYGLHRRSQKGWYIIFTFQLSPLWLGGGTCLVVRSMMKSRSVSADVCVLASDKKMIFSYPVDGTTRIVDKDLMFILR